MLLKVGTLLAVLVAAVLGFQCEPEEVYEYRLLRSALPVGKPSLRFSSSMLVDMTCLRRHERHYDVLLTVSPDPHTPQSKRTTFSPIVFGAVFSVNGTAEAIRFPKDAHDAMKDKLVELLHLMNVEPGSVKRSATTRQSSMLTLSHIHNVSTAFRTEKAVGGPIRRTQRFVRAELQQGAVHSTSDCHLRSQPSPMSGRFHIPQAVWRNSSDKSAAVSLAEATVLDSQGLLDSNDTVSISVVCGHWRVNMTGTVTELNRDVLAERLDWIPPVCNAIHITVTEKNTVVFQRSVPLRTSYKVVSSQLQAEVPLSSYRNVRTCTAQEPLSEVFGTDRPLYALTVLVSELIGSDDPADARSQYPDGHDNTPPVLLRVSSFLDCHPELISDFLTMVLVEQDKTTCERGLQVLHTLHTELVEIAFEQCLSGSCCASVSQTAVYAATRTNIRRRSFVEALVRVSREHNMSSAIAVNAVARWVVDRFTKVALFGEQLVSAGEHFDGPMNQTETHRRRFAPPRAFTQQSAFSDQLLDDVFSYSIEKSTDKYFKWWGGDVMAIGIGLLFKNEASISLSYAGALHAKVDIENEAAVKLRFFGNECAPYNVMIRIGGEITFDILAFALAQTCKSGKSPNKSSPKKKKKGRKSSHSVAQEADEAPPVVWGPGAPLALLLRWGTEVPSIEDAKRAAQQLKVETPYVRRHVESRVLPYSNATTDYRRVVAQASTTCSTSNCDVFACLEQQRPCGVEGYNLKHGLPLCLTVLFKTLGARNLALGNLFGRLGQCIRSEARRFAAQDCSSYASAMDHVLPGCLSDAGFCSLNSEDLTVAIDGLSAHRAAVGEMFRATNAQGCMHADRINDFRAALHIERVSVATNTGDLDTACETDFASPVIFCVFASVSGTDGNGRYVLASSTNVANDLISRVGQGDVLSHKNCVMPDCQCRLGSRDFTALAEAAADAPDEEPEVSPMPGTMSCFVQYAHAAADCSTNFLRDFALLDRCVEENAGSTTIPDFDKFPKDFDILGRLRSYAIATLPQRVLGSDDGGPECEEFKECRDKKGLRACKSEGSKCMMKGGSGLRTLSAAVTSIVMVRLFSNDVDPGKPWAPCLDAYYNCLHNGGTSDCGLALFSCLISPVAQWFSGQCSILTPAELWELTQAQLAFYYINELRFFLVAYTGAMWVKTCQCSDLPTQGPLDAFNEFEKFVRLTKHGRQHDFELERGKTKDTTPDTGYDTGCLPPLPIPPQKPSWGYSISFEVRQYQGFFIDYELGFEVPTDFRAAQEASLALVVRAHPGWALGLTASLEASAGADFGIGSVDASFKLTAEVFGLKGLVSPYAKLSLGGQPALPIKTSYGLIPAVHVGSVEVYVKAELCVELMWYTKCKKYKHVIHRLDGFYKSYELKPDSGSTQKQSAPVFKGYTVAEARRWISGRTVMCSLADVPDTVCAIDSLTVYLKADMPDGSVLTTEVYDVTYTEDSAPEQRFSLTELSENRTDISDYEGAKLRCVFRAEACKAGLSTEVTTDWAGVSNEPPVVTALRGRFAGVDVPFAPSSHSRCFHFYATLPVALAEYVDISLLNADTGATIKTERTLGRRVFCFAGLTAPRVMLFVKVLSRSGIGGFAFSAPALVDAVPVQFERVTVGCTALEQEDAWLLPGAPLCVTGDIVAGVSGVGPRKHVVVIDAESRETVVKHRIVSQGPAPVNISIDTPLTSKSGVYYLRITAVRGALSVDGSEYIPFGVDADAPTPGNVNYIDPDTRQIISKASANTEEVCISWSGFADEHSGLSNVTWDMKCDGSSMWVPGSTDWLPQLEAPKRMCKMVLVPDGSHCTSVVIATDARGNKREERITIVFDATPPTASVSAGCTTEALPTAEGKALWSTAAFLCATVSAADSESGVSGLNAVLQLGGVNVSSKALSGTADQVLFPDTLVDGDYIIYLTATNGAELTFTTAALVLVETAPPIGGNVVLAAGAATHEVGSMSVPLVVTGFSCGVAACRDSWLRCEHPAISQSIATQRFAVSATLPAAGIDMSTSVTAKRTGPLICRYGARTRAGRPGRSVSNIVVLDATPPVPDDRQPVSVVQSQETVYIYNGAPPLPKTTPEPVDAAKALFTSRFWRSGSPSGGALPAVGPDALANTCESALSPFAPFDEPTLLSVSGGLGQDAVASRCVRGADVGAPGETFRALLALNSVGNTVNPTPFASFLRVHRVVLRDTEGRSARTDTCFSSTLSNAAAEKLSCPVLVTSHSALPSGLRSFTSGSVVVTFTAVSAEATVAVQVTGSARPGVTVDLPQELPLGTQLHVFGSVAAPLSTAIHGMRDQESGSLGIHCEAAIGRVGSVESCTPFTPFLDAETPLKISVTDACGAEGDTLLATLRCKNQVLSSWSLRSTTFTLGTNARSYVHSAVVAPYVASLTHVPVVWQFNASALSPGVDASDAKCIVCLGTASFLSDISCGETVPCSSASSTVVLVGTQTLVDGEAYFASVTATAPQSRRLLLTSAAWIAVGRPFPSPAACTADCCASPDGTFDDGSGSDDVSCDIRCGPATATAPTRFHIEHTGELQQTSHVALSDSVRTASIPVAALLDGSFVGVEAAWNNTRSSPVADTAKWPLAANPTVPRVEVIPLELAPTSILAMVPQEWKFPASTGATLEVRCRGVDGWSAVGNASWNGKTPSMAIPVDMSLTQQPAWPVRFPCRVITTFAGRCGDTFEAPVAPFVVAPSIQLLDTCQSAYLEPGTGRVCVAAATRSSENITQLQLKRRSQATPTPAVLVDVAAGKLCVPRGSLSNSDVMVVTATNRLTVEGSCTFTVFDALGPSIQSVSIGRRVNENLHRWSDPRSLCFSADVAPGSAPWRSVQYQLHATTSSVSGPDGRQWKQAGRKPQMLARVTCVSLPLTNDDGSAAAPNTRWTLFVRATDVMGRSDTASSYAVFVPLEDPTHEDTDVVVLQSHPIASEGRDVVMYVSSTVPTPVCVKVPRAAPQASGVSPQVRCSAQAAYGEVPEDPTDLSWVSADVSKRTSSHDTVCLPSVTPFDTRSTFVSTRLECLGLEGDINTLAVFFDTAVPSCAVSLHGRRRSVRRSTGVLCARVDLSDGGRRAVSHGLREVVATLWLTPPGSAAVKVRTGRLAPLQAETVESHCFSFNATTLGSSVGRPDLAETLGNYHAIVSVTDFTGRSAACSSDVVTAVAAPRHSDAGTAARHVRSLASPDPEKLRTADNYTVTVTTPHLHLGITDAHWCVTAVRDGASDCSAIPWQSFEFGDEGTAVLLVGARGAAFTSGTRYDVLVRYDTDIGEPVEQRPAASFVLDAVLPPAPGYLVVGMSCEGDEEAVARWNPAVSLRLCFATSRATETTVTTYEVQCVFAQATSPIAMRSVPAEQTDTMQVGLDLPPESGALVYLNGDEYSVCVTAIDELGQRSVAACKPFVVITKQPPPPLVNDGIGPCRDQDKTENIETVNVNWCVGDDAAEYGVSHYSVQCFTTHNGKVPIAASSDVSTLMPPQATIIPPPATLIMGTTKLMCTVCAHGVVGPPACGHSDGIAIDSGEAVDIVLPSAPITGGGIQICATAGSCAGQHTVWRSSTEVQARWVLCNTAVRARVCAWVVNTSALESDRDEPTGAVCRDDVPGTSITLPLTLRHGEVVRVDLQCINTGNKFARRSATANVVIDPPSFAAPPFAAHTSPLGGKVCLEPTAAPHELVTQGDCTICTRGAPSTSGVYVRTVGAVPGLSMGTSNPTAVLNTKTSGANVLHAWVDSVLVVHAYMELTSGPLLIGGVPPVVVRNAWSCCVASSLCSAQMGAPHTATARFLNGPGSDTSVSSSVLIAPASPSPAPLLGGSCDVSVRFTPESVIVCIPAHVAPDGTSPRYIFRGVGPSLGADAYEFMNTTAETLFPRTETHSACHTFFVPAEARGQVNGQSAQFLAGVVDMSQRSAVCTPATVPVFLTAPTLSVEIHAEERATSVTCTLTLGSSAAPSSAQVLSGGQSMVAVLSPVGGAGGTPIRFDGTATFNADALEPDAAMRCAAIVNFEGSYAVRATSGTVEWAPLPVALSFVPALPSVLLSGAPFVTTIVALDSQGRAIRAVDLSAVVEPRDEVAATAFIEAAPVFDLSGTTRVSVSATRDVTVSGPASIGLNVTVVDRRSDELLDLSIAANGITVERIADKAPAAAIVLTGGAPAAPSQSHAVVVTIPLFPTGTATADHSSVVTLVCDLCFTPRETAVVSAGIARLPFVIHDFGSATDAVLTIMVNNSAAGYHRAPPPLVVPIGTVARNVTDWAVQVTDATLTVGATFTVNVSVTNPPANFGVVVSPRSTARVVDQVPWAGGVLLRVRFLEAPASSITVTPLAPSVVFTPSSRPADLPRSQQTPRALRLRPTRQDGLASFADSCPSGPPVVAYDILCESLPLGPTEEELTPCASQELGDAVGVVTAVQGSYLQADHDALSRTLTLRASVGIHTAPWSQLEVQVNASAQVSEAHRQTLTVVAPVGVNASLLLWTVRPDPAYICARDVAPDDATVPLSVHSVRGDTTRALLVYPCTDVFEPLAVATPSLAATGPGVDAGVATFVSGTSPGEKLLRVSAGNSVSGWPSDEAMALKLQLAVGDISRDVSLFRRSVASFDVLPVFKSAFVGKRLSVVALPRDVAGNTVTFAAAGVVVTSTTSPGCDVHFDGAAPRTELLPFSLVSPNRGDITCAAAVAIGDAPPVTVSMLLHSRNPGEAARGFLDAREAVAGVRLTVRLCLFDADAKPLSLTDTARADAGFAAASSAFSATPTVATDGDCVLLWAAPTPEAPFSLTGVSLTVTFGHDTLAVTAAPLWRFPRELVVTHTDPLSRTIAYEYPGNYTARLLDDDGRAIEPFRPMVDVCTDSFGQSYAVSSTGAHITMTPSSRPRNTIPAGALRTAMCFEIGSLPLIPRSCVPTDIVTSDLPSGLKMDPATRIAGVETNYSIRLWPMQGTTRLTARASFCALLRAEDIAATCVIESTALAVDEEHNACVTRCKTLKHKHFDPDAQSRVQVRVSLESPVAPLSTVVTACLLGAKFTPTRPITGRQVQVAVTGQCADTPLNASETFVEERQPEEATFTRLPQMAFVPVPFAEIRLVVKEDHLAPVYRVFSYIFGLRSESPSLTLSESVTWSSVLSTSDTLASTMSLSRSLSIVPTRTLSLSWSVTPTTSVTATASASLQPTLTASSSATTTTSATTSQSMSHSATSSATVSSSASTSASASVSRSSSASVSASATTSLSSSVSSSASATLSASVSTSSSQSATLSASVSASASTSMSLSASTSVSMSTSFSSSVSTSASTSTSMSMSTSASSSVSTSVSTSQSASTSTSMSSTVSFSASMSQSTFIGRPATHIVVTVPLRQDGVAGWHSIGEIRAVDATGANVAQGRPIRSIKGNTSELANCVDGDESTRCALHEYNETIAGQFVIELAGPHDIVELQVFETMGPPGVPFMGQGCHKQRIELVLEADAEAAWLWTHAELGFGPTTIVQLREEFWGEFSLHRWRVYPRLDSLIKTDGQRVRWLRVSTNSTDWHGMSEVRALLANGTNVAALRPVALRTGQVQADLERCNDDKKPTACLYRRLYSHRVGEWEIDFGTLVDVVEVHVISNTGPCLGTGGTWCARQRIELFNLQGVFNWGVNFAGRDETQIFPVAEPFPKPTPVPPPTPWPTPAPPSVGVWGRFVELYTTEQAFVGFHEIEAFAVGEPTKNLLQGKMPALITGYADGPVTNLARCIDGAPSTFCRYRADEYGTAVWRADLGAVYDIVSVRTVGPVRDCATCELQAVRLLGTGGEVAWTHWLTAQDGLNDVVATYPPQTPIPTPAPTAAGVFVDRIVVETIGAPVAYQTLSEIEVYDASNTTVAFDTAAPLETAVRSGDVAGLDLIPATDGNQSTLFRIAGDGNRWDRREAHVTLLLPYAVDTTRIIVRNVTCTVSARLRISAYRGPALRIWSRELTSGGEYEVVFEAGTVLAENSNVRVFWPAPAVPPSVGAVLLELPAGPEDAMLYVADLFLWNTSNVWMRPTSVIAVLNPVFGTFPTGSANSSNISLPTAADGNWTTVATAFVPAGASLAVVARFEVPELNLTEVNATHVLAAGLRATVTRPLRVAYTDDHLSVQWSHEVNTVAFDSAAGARTFSLTSKQEPTPVPETPQPPTVPRNILGNETRGRQAVRVVLNFTSAAAPCVFSELAVTVLVGGKHGNLTEVPGELEWYALAGTPGLRQPLAHCLDRDNATQCSIRAEPPVPWAGALLPFHGSFDVVTIAFVDLTCASPIDVTLYDDRDVLAWTGTVEPGPARTAVLPVGPLIATATVTATLVATNTTNVSRTETVVASVSQSPTASSTLALSRSRSVSDSASHSTSATATVTASVSQSTSQAVSVSQSHSTSRTVSGSATVSASHPNVTRSVTSTATTSASTSQSASLLASASQSLSESVSVSEKATASDSLVATSTASKVLSASVTRVSLGEERPTLTADTVTMTTSGTAELTASLSVVPVDSGSVWPLPTQQYATLYLTVFAEGRDFFNRFQKDSAFRAAGKLAAQRHTAALIGLDLNRVQVGNWQARRALWDTAARGVEAQAVVSTLIFRDGELSVNCVFEHIDADIALQQAAAQAARLRESNYAADIVSLMAAMLPGDLDAPVDGGLATEAAAGVPAPRPGPAPPKEPWVCGVACVAGILAGLVVLVLVVASVSIFLAARVFRRMKAPPEEEENTVDQFDDVCCDDRQPDADADTQGRRPGIPRLSHRNSDASVSYSRRMSPRAPVEWPSASAEGVTDARGSSPREDTKEDLDTLGAPPAAQRRYTALPLESGLEDASESSPPPRSRSRTPAPKKTKSKKKKVTTLE